MKREEEEAKKEKIVEAPQDWVAEFVMALDEGVIVSGAPWREEVVEKVLEILDEWLLQGFARKRKRQRETEREKRFGSVGLRLQRRQRQKKEESGGADDDDDDDIDVEGEKNKKRKKVDGVVESTSSDYIYPPHINPLPLTFSTCTASISSSVPSVSIPIEYPIPRCERPSLSSFESHLRGMRGTLKTDQTADRGFYAVDGQKDVDFPTPLVLTSCIAHWPAICEPTRSWDSPRYLLSMALGGRRLVPVEIGRSYVDEGWGQKIVPFGEFMGTLLDDDHDRNKKDKMITNSASPNTGENYKKSTEHKKPEELKKKRKKKKRQKWYLAQHDLFTQMPALRADIAIPEYCYLSSIPTPSTSPDASPTIDSHKSSPSPPLRQIHLNAWLGPAGTISPLHTDPHHNILAQVVGRKYVRLYAPSDTEKVYPRGGGSSNSNSNSNGNGNGNSRSDRRKRTKEHDGDKYTATINQYDDNDDEDDNNSDKATTPHQSANTSHVDVGDILAWAHTWESETGAGSSSSNDNDNDNDHGNDNDNVQYDPPSDQSLRRQQQQQQQQQHQKALQNIRTQYPLFLDAPYLETVLEPGECLFIPRSWWHYVRSLSTSFSVSFWWD